MSKDEFEEALATFRFGVISDFVIGVKLSYGEKEKLLDQIVSRSYKIPGSSRTTISRSTIMSWINDYKKAGFKIIGLYPRTRKDKGIVKSLTSEIKMAIKEIKKEKPALKVPALIKELQHRKLILSGEELNSSTIYRYINCEDLKSINEDAVDKRHFEAENPNEIWQSDILHGPLAIVDGKNKKTYLLAIIDDHSRLIIHAEFYLNETFETFKDGLKKSITKRGLPQKIYIDNGSCYRTLNLEQITAFLGIAIKHSRPYIPQGRGKIERWFRYVRDNFLSLYTIKTLEALNESFDTWVDEYNNKIHGTTRETPLSRYRKNLECVRPAPHDLINYFRIVEFRRVKKDRTIRLNNVLFEAPVSLIDKKIETRFHVENPDEVEIFFNNQSFGFAVKVDPHINANIGRSWKTCTGKTKKDGEEMKQPENSVIKSGQLFEGKKND